MSNTITCPPDTGSIRVARQAILDMLHLESPAADDVALLVSELVANAVLHGRTAFEATATRVAGVVRVDVTDHSPTPPCMKFYGADAPTGRGLRLVDRLASRWGVNPAVPGPGKTVWFELEVGMA
jgi:anti-sigma regulatory factor (Ser/Thr protein kinase)